MVELQDSNVQGAYWKYTILRCKVQGGDRELYQLTLCIVEMHYTKAHNAYCMVDLENIKVHCA